MFCKHKPARYYASVRVFGCFVIQKFRPRHDTRAFTDVLDSSIRLDPPRVDFHWASRVHRIMQNPVVVPDISSTTLAGVLDFIDHPVGLYFCGTIDVLGIFLDSQKYSTVRCDGGLVCGCRRVVWTRVLPSSDSLHGEKEYSTLKT